MPETTKLDCKVYLDVDTSSGQLAVYIAHLLNGTVEGRTVLTKDGEIDVLMNDEYDELARREFPDGSLHFPYLVEFYAEPQQELKKRVATVAAVLSHFWSKGVPAVAACDYEEKLPNQGGYRSHTVPWVRDLATSRRM